MGLSLVKLHFEKLVQKWMLIFWSNENKLRFISIPCRPFVLASHAVTYTSTPQSRGVFRGSYIYTMHCIVCG